jgi:hypothetical protein
MVKTLQERVEVLENIVDLPSPCPCFDDDDIIPLQSCERTATGGIKIKGEQGAMYVDRRSCTISKDNDGTITSPITPKEYWVCVDHLLDMAAGQSLSCPAK